MNPWLGAIASSITVELNQDMNGMMEEQVG
jgi:C4-dicarboxylate-specific signal transduction histidine kinase